MKKANYEIMLDEEIAKLDKGLSPKIRPITKSGSGRYSKYTTDHSDRYIHYLEAKAVKYVIGNDSPRGGILGKYIQLISKKEF